MRAHFGGYFLGQVGTFMYLTEAMRVAPQFKVAFWPQFSLYNLLVANFWPLYWLGHFMDRAKLDAAYWHVFDSVHARAGEAFQMFEFLSR
jgi:hypothetical protein